MRGGESASRHRSRQSSSTHRQECLIRVHLSAAGRIHLLIVAGQNSRDPRRMTVPLWADLERLEKSRLPHSHEFGPESAANHCGFFALLLPGVP